MRNIFKNILCRIRPGAQLNIAFGAVLFIPVFVTTLFSVTYYSQKIKQEAAAKIASELKIAEMIFQESVAVKRRFPPEIRFPLKTQLFILNLYYQTPALSDKQSSGTKKVISCPAYSFFY